MRAHDLGIFSFVLVALIAGCSSSGNGSTKDDLSSNAGSGGMSGGGGQSNGGQASGGQATLGPSPTLDSCAVFPPDNAWNLDISNYPVRVDSDQFINSIGRDAPVHPDFGSDFGIPYSVVDATQPQVPIVFTAYGDESDPGPYPVPADAPIEGGASSDGDRHVLVVDTGNCTLYELYRAFPVNAGESWEADCGAVFNLNSNDLRPFGWTSADAAGLPVFSGLARYDEVVEKRAINHALRFTASRTQQGLIAPARHYASSNTDPSLPPMGLRVRLKADYDCSAFSDPAQVVCTALKHYGMILADNGSPWYITGAPDSRFNDDQISDLKTITGDAFEVVDTGPIETY